VNREEHIAALKAQGSANAHAAVAKVREWGGAADIAILRHSRLGRGAARAVKLGLLVKSDGWFRLNQPIT
jgi:hypothetical protein